MRLPITINLDISDDATAEEVVRLLGAICAQVEDDEDGIVLSSSVDAPHPAWQEVPADRYVVHAQWVIAGETAKDVALGAAARLEEMETGEWTSTDRIASVVVVGAGDSHEYRDE